MILLSAYNISGLFSEMGSSMFGSPEFFGIFVILGVLFLLFLLNVPDGFILIAGMGIVLGFSMVGGIFTQLLGIVAVVLGVLIALGIWFIFKKGDSL